ncbi:GDSL-type esterase/lipase family protein [Pedobacter sp. JY14-1]|uniref:GDSL-type esterase/lipase family protein n=1 Tax=Pedobacter sp. JY14-1 TaxID=3034151 RepID=UPI0023E15422|nr:GDSL-type esterase/lipase family protein [Pedobacter sp. JY14-1]
MRIFCISLITFLCSLCFQADAVVRITCIGASITYGHGIPDREKQSFSGQLQQLLGSGYLVKNFGVSGTTMLSKGDYPYISTPQYQQALKSNPDIVFIDLGGNDAKLVNRGHLADYESDYKNMISAFRALPSHPRVIIMLPVVSFVKDSTGIWDPVICKQIIPKARKVAYDTGLEVLDMHPLLIDQPERVPDLIHPDVKGSAVLARRLYETVLLYRDGQHFDLFSRLAEVKSIPGLDLVSSANAVESFYGFHCLTFKLSGRECRIVKPKISAAGHPYVWRARFWGHEPQADIALLERGYHIVYCDASELFGNPEAISLWNNFYKLLRKAGLGKKAAMEGMSRGAVYAYNWAAANPGKIACVYVDNPVLDLKTWPGSPESAKQYPDEHQQFLKDYGLKEGFDPDSFKGSPIDKIAEIVKGGYPNLILCADADEAVSPETNTLLFEKKVIAAGGKITVFHKPGAKHHPHSLPNPKIIVDFITGSVSRHP